MNQGTYQFVSGGAELLSFVGLILLAIGTWRLFLVTTRRALVISVAAIALQLLIAGFWQILIPLSNHLRLLDDLLGKLFQNDFFFESLSYVNVALNATIYLPLAYYFFLQRKREVQASSAKSTPSPL
jgi:hypothetical protein